MAIINNSDENRAAELYNTYYGTMLGVAKGILFDSAQAEDAVSESFIKIMDNLEKIEDILSCETRGYIVIITRNTAINMLNKSKNEISIGEVYDLQDNSLSVLEEITAAEARDAIVKCIRSLPAALSDVIYLSAVMDRTYEEIAGDLGISKDAVKMRISRAKRALRALLQQEAVKNEE